MLGFATGLVLGCLIGVVGTLGTLLLVAAIPSEGPRKTRALSFSALAIAAATVLVTTVVSRLVNLRYGAIALLFLLIVLTSARLRGLITGLATAAFAALVLSVLLPPPWSLRVTRPRDQVLLVLFILSAMVGSRVASGNEGRV